MTTGVIWKIFGQGGKFGGFDLGARFLKGVFDHGGVIWGIFGQGGSFGGFLTKGVNLGGFDYGGHLGIFGQGGKFGGFDLGGKLWGF